MQREVVKILKKYLNYSYDNDYDSMTEIMYISPFNILLSGGVTALPLDNWTEVTPQPEDSLVRALARELIIIIKGIDYDSLYLAPDRDRVIRILRDIAPLDEKEQIEWAEGSVDFVLKELRSIVPHSKWRGQRIKE